MTEYRTELKGGGAKSFFVQKSELFAEPPDPEIHARAILNGESIGQPDPMIKCGKSRRRRVVEPMQESGEANGDSFLQPPSAEQIVEALKGAHTPAPAIKHYEPQESVAIQTGSEADMAIRAKRTQELVKKIQEDYDINKDNKMLRSKMTTIRISNDGTKIVRAKNGRYFEISENRMTLIEDEDGVVY